MVDFDIVKSMEYYYKYLKYRTNTISGTSPLTFKSNGRPLKNYRIYVNTVNVESMVIWFQKAKMLGSIV